MCSNRHPYRGENGVRAYLMLARMRHKNIGEDIAMTWKVTSALLGGLLLWFSLSLVRVENQRYALQSGMCRSTTTSSVADLKCLDAVETRTGWWWHLYHALLP